MVLGLGIVPTFKMGFGNLNFTSRGIIYVLYRIYKDVSDLRVCGLQLWRFAPLGFGALGL